MTNPDEKKPTGQIMGSDGDGLTNVNRDIATTSDLNQRFKTPESPNPSSHKEEASSQSYNTMKLPILRVFNNVKADGATAKMVAKTLNLPIVNVERRLLVYHKWGWLYREHPLYRRDPNTGRLLRKAGRPKFVYWLTRKGLHELQLLEQLAERGLPLKPRQYKIPEDGNITTT